MTKGIENLLHVVYKQPVQVSEYQKLRDSKIYH